MKIDVESLEKAVAETTGSKAVGRFVKLIFEAALDLRKGFMSEQTSEAMLRHQRSGRSMSSLPPYGMMPDPQNRRRLIPNEYEEMVIKRIIELHKEGLGLRAICRKLEEESYRPRQVKKKIDGQNQYVPGTWQHALVGRILKRAKQAEKIN